MKPPAPRFSAAATRTLFLAALCLALPLPCLAGGAIHDIRQVGNTCWAVGDNGTCLRSDDGGKSWASVSLPSKANIHAIVADGKLLHLVGGQAVLGHFSQAGEGVILRSDDGGKTFAPLGQTVLPYLRGGYFRGNFAVVVGEASGRSPGGLWRSVDAGKTWVAGELPYRGYLTAGSWRSAGVAYLVGANQTLVEMRPSGGPLVRSAVETLPSDLTCVSVDSDNVAWCAGQNGELFQTTLGQKAIRRTPPRLPANAHYLADFAALAVVSPREAYLGGGLTGVIFHTADSGKTWKRLPAPMGSPLTSLATMDAKTLLAGTGGGRIWRSQDGAKSWTLVHGSDATDILFITCAGDASAYPAITMHALAGCDVAVLQVTHLSTGQRPADQASRCAAAAAGANVYVLNDFPSLAQEAASQASQADILAAWSARLDVSAQSELTRQLAAAIQLYRPRVVVVGPAGEGERGVRAERRLVARTAIEACALATKERKDTGAVGLHQWSPRRVFIGREKNDAASKPWDVTRLADMRDCTARVDTTTFFEDVPEPLDMLTQRALWSGVEADAFARPHHLTGYWCRSEANFLPYFATGLRQIDLLKATPLGAPLDLEAMTALRLAIASGTVPTATAKYVRALGAARDDATRVLAADRLMLTWQKLLEEGRLVHAHEARNAMLQHGGLHPLARRVSVLALAQSFSADYLSLQSLLGPPPKLSPEAAQSVLRQFQGWTAWNDAPEGKLLLARMQLALGQVAPAQKTLTELAGGPYGSAWGEIASLELLLMNAEPPQRITREKLRAAFTSHKGKFDGVLEEPLWAKAAPAGLVLASGKKPPGELAGTVRALRTAGGFLVLGVSVPTSVGSRWSLEIALDMDRDCWTQLRLTGDDRERVDACMLLRHGPRIGLNKRYVQLRSKSNEKSTQFEIALPLALLRVPEGEAMGLLQIRATRTKGGQSDSVYFQPQPGTELLSEHAGLLELPAAR